MAVRHGYGKIEGTDALVFAYDTGDTVNSYKGRPTTNYGPADFADWTPEAGSAGDTAERIPTGNYYKGQPTYNCRVDVTQQYRGINKAITDLATIAGAGGTITVSCMIKNNNSRTDQYINAYIGHDFSSVRWVAANSDWQKVQWTVNASNLNSNNVEFRPVTRVADEYLEMTMPMVEVNVGSASQFVNGTRSATEGLKDLTGNTSIDLTDVSFDSNAQIAFDGTDEIMLLEKLITTQDFTVEQVIYEESFNSEGWTFEQYASDSGRLIINSDTVNRLRFFIGGSAVTSPNNIPLNSYHHIVCVREDGVGYVYENGVLTASGGISTNTITDITAAVGGSRQFASGKQFNGEIPVTKVYNRPLTAAEVKNNYRHYKNRFGI